MSDKELIKLLAEALSDAKAHLEYCGYGDRWERECAGDLPKEIDSVLDLMYELQILKRRE